ncbi:PE domain-containing protein [Gandjariella thermophila]|uniref:Uncharacterized protein n=1 Tax=Gandjariella thermophila TaxID=1931992 RepID=A0A4D4JFF1_9PSEU|nr:PE domain-containing protein [Gandjariella thermophila]GDY33740.1 hypothetical protein GTS_53730 [Gandjariella thermophila]
MLLKDGGGGSPWYSDMVSFKADTPSGQQTFMVSRDGVQTLIKGLQDAYDKLQELYDQSYSLREVGPPGGDPYSGQAANTIKHVAGDDPGGYGWANKQAQQALKNTIANLQASASGYQNAEDANRQKFGGIQS